MEDNLKYLIKKISDDIGQLYFLYRRNFHRSEDEYFEFQKEINERLHRIHENSEHLNDIANDIDWDNRTNRKFQKLNALLLIFPTILGLTLIIWGITKFSASVEYSDKLHQKISDFQNENTSLRKENARLKRLIDTNQTALGTFRFQGNSKTKVIPFGGGDSLCMYSIQYKDVVIMLELDSSKEKILSSSIRTKADENILNCDSMPNSPIRLNRHFYQMKNYSVKNSAIHIEYSQIEGNPKCQCFFEGNFIYNKIIGTIKWNRTDVPPPLDYKINCKVDLRVIHV